MFFYPFSEDDDDDDDSDDLDLDGLNEQLDEEIEDEEGTTQIQNNTLNWTLNEFDIFLLEFSFESNQWKSLKLIIDKFAEIFEKKCSFLWMDSKFI